MPKLSLELVSAAYSCRDESIVGAEYVILPTYEIQRLTSSTTPPLTAGDSTL